jgi:carboxyl-terminal processing protease
MMPNAREDADDEYLWDEDAAEEAGTDTSSQERKESSSVAAIKANRFFKNARLILAFIVVFALGVALGMYIKSPFGENQISTVPLIGDGLSATPDPSANFTDFWKVWNILNSQYVITHASSTMPTTQDKMWGAIEGMTAAYGDPYTVFFPPTQAKEFQDDISGSFGGIGLEIDEDAKGNLVVVAPLKGTPAAAAGFQPNDLITAIDGKSTSGVSSDDAVTLIRGPVGSTVTLTILRGTKEQTIPVKRETIQVPEIEYGLNKTTGVYTIALYEFTTNSAQLFETAFTAFKASGSKLLVIDLRDNPGGYLDSAVTIASHFLPKGATIVTEDYKGHQPNDVLTSTGTDDVPANTKVVMLLNQGSASASEILSGALKDNHVATIIGTRSFGKGSVQELINIDGGSLKITIARWLTPDGVSIMGNGITPDIDVEAPTSTPITPTNDPQMARAVQFLQTGK